MTPRSLIFLAFIPCSALVLVGCANSMHTGTSGSWSSLPKGERERMYRTQPRDPWMNMEGLSFKTQHSSSIDEKRSKAEYRGKVMGRRMQRSLEKYNKSLRTFP